MGPDLDVLVVSVSLPLTVAAVAALALSVLAALVEAALVALAGLEAWRWSPAPHVVRRAVFVLCGLGLAVPTVAAATDATGPHHDSRHGSAHEPRQGTHQARHQACPPHCHGRLSGLSLPDLPTRDLPVTDRPTLIHVRPGDCLWSIAVARSPVGADDAEIARVVQSIYRLNHTRIGTDPDLIFPGTHLTAPEATP